jgi:hypothetical protein
MDLAKRIPRRETGGIVRSRGFCRIGGDEDSSRVAYEVKVRILEMMRGEESCRGQYSPSGSSRQSALGVALAHVLHSPAHPGPYLYPSSSAP